MAEISHLLFCFYNAPPSSRTFRESLLLNIPTLVRISSDKSRPDFSKFWDYQADLNSNFSLSTVYGEHGTAEDPEKQVEHNRILSVCVCVCVCVLSHFSCI